jgi:hypothetical protein
MKRVVGWRRSGKRFASLRKRLAGMETVLLAVSDL